MLLILADTPNISTRLNKIEATYWDRLYKIGIGLLDAEAVRKALRTPLERMGYCIKADALKNAASEAQCYPYFLQVIGRELHRAAKAEQDKLERGNEIGNEILKRALNKFRLKRNTCYSGRYQEVQDLGILRSAESVAQLFVSRKRKSISTGIVAATVAQSIDRKQKRKQSAEAESTRRRGSRRSFDMLAFFGVISGRKNSASPEFPA